MSNKPFGRGDRSRRRFNDDDFYTPPPTNNRPFPSTGPRFTQAPTGPFDTTDATVKWFNPTKGFGFVTPADGSGDAFLHASVVEAAGIREVPDGATVHCEIGQGSKGRQVARIISIDTATAAPRAPRPMAPRAPRGGERDLPVGDATEMEGTVKWYSAQKGFGFVAAPDGGKDIFVHSNTLRRAQIASLDPEQPVRMMVVPTAKGREATTIELI